MVCLQNILTLPNFLAYYSPLFRGLKNPVRSLVDPRYFELGYRDQRAIANSNPFPFKRFFSHLLSPVSNPLLFRTVFSFPLRVQNSWVQRMTKILLEISVTHIWF